MFYNYSPVKLIHGEGSLQRAVAEIPADCRVTVLHGSTLEKHSLKVMETLATWASFGATRIRIDSDEPTEASIDALLRQIPPETTFIVGIGGGSVMDSTKAAAVCLGNQLSAAALKTSAPMSWRATTKFGLVSTRPGSGSELNNAFVVMDEGSKFKRSYFSLHSYPLFAIHDPLFYQSLQSVDYASGLADAVSHVIDQYLVERDAQVVQDLMSINFLEIGSKLIKKAPSPAPEDFLQLAWFSALISSGILSRGVRTSWILHEVAHSLASLCGLPHVKSITTVSRAVLSMARHPQNRLKQIANALSPQKEPGQDSHTDGERVAKFFSGLGLPVGLESLSGEDIEHWRKEMGTLCPNLTSEEVTYLCTHP